MCTRTIIILVTLLSEFYLLSGLIIIMRAVLQILSKISKSMPNVEKY